MERKLREEKKQRDIEIQRRKMKGINVSKPATGNVEELIALPVSVKAGTSVAGRGSKQTSSPSTARSTAVGTGMVIPAGDGSSLNVPKEADVLDFEISNPENGKFSYLSVVPLYLAITCPLDQVVLETLMESSLSNLTDPSTSTNQRAAFKPTQSLSTTSQTSAFTKTYSSSTKARAWTANTSSLEGVFAQHSQQTQGQLSHPQQEDDFGEFHSGPANLSLPYSRQQIPGRNGNLTMATQRPVASTSVSGLTKEGYFSSDAMQSAPYTTYSVQDHQTLGSQRTPSNVSSVDVTKFPSLYMDVYKRCVQSGEEYLSTELLFPVLLSSQLPKPVLRDLWTRANRAAPGKLNQMELFVLLGFIGLVQVQLSGTFFVTVGTFYWLPLHACIQSGNPSPTADDLKRAPHPPIPKLSAIQVSMVNSL